MLPLSVQRASFCSSSLRRSYAEISRFVRTPRARHGTLAAIVPLRRIGVRNFCTSNVQRNIEPRVELRKTLDDYKISIRSQHASSASRLRAETVEDIGHEQAFYGYLSSRRDVSKKLSFALLRSMDQRCIIQLVSVSHDSEGNELEVHKTLKSLKEWTPVRIRGISKERKPAKDDTVFGIPLINHRELELVEIEPLNSMPADLIIKEDTVFPPEHRHLQLRTQPHIRNNLAFRNRVTNVARSRLLGDYYTEIETPILFKSTPEGAREFLVPTRQKGLAYALPQSPQQYKQILMASGVTKYFQFARCFRDEDLRADRQPEFTQLDVEMAFAAEEDVMSDMEGLLRKLWRSCLDLTLPEVFRRMTYQEAMAKYGVDKPDLRFGMEIQDITNQLPKSLLSMITDLPHPTIEAFKLSLSEEDPARTRKFVAAFLDSPEGKPFTSNPSGAPGVFVCDASKPMNGLAAFGHEFVMNPPPSLSPDHGDLIILQARPTGPFSGGSTPLGALRLALHKAAVAHDLVAKPQGFEFIWITDFPLFSPTTDADPGQGGSAGLSATHHPFTAPKTPKDVELLLSAPEECIAAHYDIVLNGVELGGGSRRIHSAALQEFIFSDILKMKPERVEDFRHLLEVLRSGCPPHAGIALGWDRLVATMLGRESVRDVIAFPKSGKGEDGMVKSPSELTPSQLNTYHLELRK
ncbi:hypothetical protein P154DRAFT_479822 [Amniculicola lignicola CBS 123094]|uniref:Aminoacyl-transfer RNA synthetases class-II family profile domain-containing protein n=1 Tax=Amniculicola lignicola CBS 123094 TaxID=1392246 RepID=A0A6A5X1S4_9PLEO|nr:hypothetical protein P154DRAFT_479822 [Amniculicola lignicola CBS 123094]